MEKSDGNVAFLKRAREAKYEVRASGKEQVIWEQRVLIVGSEGGWLGEGCGAGILQAGSPQSQEGRVGGMCMGALPFCTVTSLTKSTTAI